MSLGCIAQYIRVSEKGSSLCWHWFAILTTSVELCIIISRMGGVVSCHTWKVSIAFKREFNGDHDGNLTSNIGSIPDNILPPCLPAERDLLLTLLLGYS